MTYEAFVGLRYFRGRESGLLVAVITLISIAGVAVGVSALTTVLAVMRGFEGDLKGKILSTYAHVLVDREQGLVDGWRERLQLVRATPGVASAGAFVRNEVMVSSPTNLSGVTLKGVDPATAAVVNGLGRSLEEGATANLERPELIRRVALEDGPAPLPAAPPGVVGADGAPDDDASAAGWMPPLASPPAGDRVLPGVILGRELKRNLLVTVGDVVNLVSPLGDLGPSGPVPKARPFRVAGVFYTGMYEYDTKIVYTTIEQAQRFLGLGDGVTGIEVKVAAGEEDAAPALATALAARMGGDVRVRDWRRLNEGLFAALEMERIAMFIILGFIVLVASFNIVSNLVLVVLEKSQEIAILKSLGASDGGVLRIFVTQGLIIGGVGAAAGLVVGLATCLYLAWWGFPLDPEVYYIDALPVAIDPVEVVAIALGAVVVAFLATLYPAWQAARLAPVDGLRLA